MSARITINEFTPVDYQAWYGKYVAHWPAHLPFILRDPAMDVLIVGGDGLITFYLSDDTAYQLHGKFTPTLTRLIMREAAEQYRGFGTHRLTNLGFNLVPE